jgi:hypothetical protein
MEDLNEILKTEEYVDVAFFCHDCEKPVRVRAQRDGDGIIFQPQDGGAGYYPTLANGEKEYFVKCAACFEEKPKLTEFNPTEVYTRVVGYMRPVQNFNAGKREEYRQRQNFTNAVEA